MKNLVIILLQNLLKVFFIFPIRSNRVFFSAYSGRSYACSPKCISEELMSQMGEDIQIVWAFIEPRDYDFLPTSIIRVKFKRLKYIYYRLTSKVVVDNVEGWSVLPKRPAQYVVNTWHGGGAYKGVGLQRLDSTVSLDKNMLRKHDKVDLYISSSKAFTKMTLRDSFHYKGEVMECGLPRNDRLINATSLDMAAIKKRLGLEETVKYALFAPTFRKDVEFEYDFNVAETLAALTRRFGGEWKMLYRTHYYLTDSNFDSAGVIDVSEVEDMQDILLISDVLITDYSSSMWDFSLSGKLGFLYMPDLNNYKGERAFYTPIDDWPYPYSESTIGLCDIIKKCDIENAKQKIKKHHEALVSMETGIATRLVVQRIISVVSNT